MEPQFNEPQYNEVLGITNNICQPDQGFSKMYGTEPQYNEPWYKEILAIQKPKRSIYPHRISKCQRMTKDKYETGKQGWKSFNSVMTDNLHS